MERSEHQDKSSPERPDPIPPGRQLRKVREARGMAVADVAATLRLSVATVDNLEQDRYDRLPPDTFVRGYLRTYARLLELDPQPLVDAFDQGSGGPSPRPLRATKPVQTSPDLSMGMKYLLPLALAGGVLFFAGSWGLDLYRGLGQPDAPQRSAVDVIQEVDEQLAESLEPESGPTGRSARDAEAPVADDRLANVTDRETSPSPESDAADDGASGPIELPTRIRAIEEELAARAQAAVDATEAADASTAGQETDTVSGEAADDDQTRSSGSASDLVMRFTGPSWVEVRDSSGERLLYGLIDEQGTRRLQGSPPYSLVIGDVGHVSVELNGEAVDLGDVSPGRVARVRVPAD